jgi:hypothetical protein
VAHCFDRGVGQKDWGMTPGGTHFGYCQVPPGLLRCENSIQQIKHLLTRPFRAAELNRTRSRVSIRSGKRGVSCIRNSSVVNYQERSVSIGFNWLPGRITSGPAAPSPLACARGRPTGDRRRCAASSNRLVFCRRFELTSSGRFGATSAAKNFLKLAPRDGTEILQNRPAI